MPASVLQLAVHKPAVPETRPAAVADALCAALLQHGSCAGSLCCLSCLVHWPGDVVADHACISPHRQGDSKSPMEYIQAAEPIKVSGMVVASYGSKCDADTGRQGIPSTSLGVS